MAHIYHANQRMLLELEQLEELLASLHGLDGALEQPDRPDDSVRALYSQDGVDAKEGETYYIYNQADMDAFVCYVKDKRNTKGVTFSFVGSSENEIAAAGSEKAAHLLEVHSVIAPVILASDPDTNSPVIHSSSGPCFEGTFEGNHNYIKVTLPTPAAGGDAAANDDAETGEGKETFVGAGLFGGIGEYGTIQNLRVTGTVTVDESAGDAVDAVGGVAAYNCGIIDHVVSNVAVKAPSCYNVGGIVGFNDAVYPDPVDQSGTGGGVRGTVRNCENKGDVTGKEKVGGIAGENAGLIASCSNGGSITAVSARKNGVGGIAGRNGNNDTPVEKGKIEDCYNKGIVLCQTVDANGKTEEGQWVGGIAGFQNAFSICGYTYNTGDITGYSYVHNIIGENENTTEEGIVNSYGEVGKVTVTDPDWEPGSDDERLLSEAEMKGTVAVEDGKFLVDLLNEKKAADADDGSEARDSEGSEDEDSGTKKYWKRNPAVDEGYPTLVNKDKRVAESGNVAKPKVVFLENADDLEAAVKDAGAGGTVVVKKQIVMKKAIQIYVSVTFQRGFTGTDAMFKVDIDDIADGEPGYLSWGTSTFDGSLYTEDGSGGDARDTDTDKVTLFEIVRGRLRLRGDIVLKNCDIAVLVQATAGNTAQVEVNYADISANEYAIKLENANSNFILDAFAANEVEINGTVYLSSGTKITLESSLVDWTKNLIVSSVVTTSKTVIANCASAAIAKESASKVIVNGVAANYSLKNIII